MNRFLIGTLLGSLIILSGCGTASNQNKEAKGGKVYGGSFTFGHSENLNSFYPYRATDLMTSNLVSQVFEGLVKFDPRTMEIVPCLAESWSISEDGMVYTFHLKKGVKFQDNACFAGGVGRAVTAEDVQYSFEQLCTKDPNNLVFSYTLEGRLTGADEFYAGKASSISGIEVVDASTLKLRIQHPSNTFLYILAQSALVVFPKEGIEKYGINNRVGTGPFILPDSAALHEQDLVLFRNPNYHGTDSLGNQLPFLDSLVMRVFKSKKDEVDDFLVGSIEIATEIPNNTIRELVETQIEAFQSKNPKYILDRVPEMATSYYEFAMKDSLISDVRIRQALNYAIDRNKLIENVLKGEAYGPGVNGICSSSFPGYATSEIEGYSYNPEKAKQLLADAGYPNGKNFPNLELQLNLGGHRNQKIASEIQNQLWNCLGVNIDLEVLDRTDRMDNDRFSQYQISRKAWIADYPSPESFLALFYGQTVPESLDQPSYPNTSRYQNQVFDSLYEKALASTDKAQRLNFFLQAEKELMKDPPIIVLWHTETNKIMQSKVRNYYSNPMDYWDFSQVYIKEVPVEETPPPPPPATPEAEN